MALIQCRDCNHAVSDHALACPSCGRMVRARSWWAMTIGWGVIMSVLISFVLWIAILAGIVVLVGGVGALGVYLDQQQPSPTPTPAATPFPIR